MNTEENVKQTKKRPGVSRREFIAGTVGGLVVGAVAGAAAGSLGFPKTITQTLTQTQTQTVTSAVGIPSTWDYSADVVIMGGGTTGLSAALEAVGAGAKVIVLEKTDSVLHASSGHCAGTIVGCGSAIQKAAGVTDSPDQYYAELVGTGGASRFPAALARQVADRSGAAVDWLAQQGIQWAPYCPILDGQGTAPRMFAVAYPLDSSSYPGVLAKNATAKGVTFMFNTPVTGLYRDTVNGVVGVKAQSAGKTINVKANRGVVIAAGDAANNKALQQQFGASLADWFNTLPTLVSRWNSGDTGDGLTVAMAVGAAPMCLDQTAATAPTFSTIMGNSTSGPDISYGYSPGSTNPNAKLPAYQYSLGITAYSIFVNNAGNRYTNEQGSTTGADTYAQPNHQVFMIWDNTPVGLNVVAHVSGGHNFIKDWIAEGDTTQANTLSDLATALGINPTGLASTVAKWNGYVAAKSDPDFKRTTFATPITTAPFYALKPVQYSVGSTVNGTLNVNLQTLQVLDEAGNVIPRLYAGGDCGKAGNIGGGHGTHMAWTFISGRIAGTNAAGEKPWSS